VGRSLRLRLSAMMFLQYFVLGAWVVTLPTFLMAAPPDGGLNLPAEQVGLLIATLSIAATVSPLFVGLLADRLFATQRVLAVLHLAGAALLAAIAVVCVLHREEVDYAFEKHALAEPVGDDELWRLLWERESIRAYLAGPNSYDAPPFFTRLPFPRVWERLGLTHSRAPRLRHPPTWQNVDTARQRLAELEDLTRPAVERLRRHPDVAEAAGRAFPPLFVLMLLNALGYMPTLTLSTSISFRNLPDHHRGFAVVRAVGTAGWAAAGLFVGCYLDPVSVGPLALGAIAAFVTGVYCLTLPHTPPAGPAKSLGDALGLPALRMLADRAFLVFVLTAVMVTTIFTFHNTFANKFLADRGVTGAAAVQTLSQCAEVACILLIPAVQARLGTKRMMLLGLTASFARFALYAVGVLPLVILIALPLQGVGYSFFFIAAAIYVDRRSPRELRASAQGLVTVITSGVGAFVGNWFAGRVVEFHASPTGIDWTGVWLVPALASLFVTLAFALSFWDSAVPPFTTDAGSGTESTTAVTASPDTASFTPPLPAVGEEAGGEGRGTLP
jgi:nucleoside transporter